MKFLLALPLILCFSTSVTSTDGVDPTPMNVPIQASTQNKINIGKILNILQQGLPQTSKQSSSFLTYFRRSKPHKTVDKTRTKTSLKTTT